MTSPLNPRHNQLLSALPMSELNRLSPELELIPMPIGRSFGEFGGKSQYVYFPTTAILSLFYVIDESNVLGEIASVGNEGMLGLSLIMEGNTTPSLPIVHTAGFGYRMKAQLLMEEFNRAGVMKRLLLRYTQALLTQTSLTAECNRHHSVKQRLCRWLLQTLDRTPSNELTFTRELAASMFGAKIEEVMEALAKLQQFGLIDIRPDQINVLNRHELEHQACECYKETKWEFDRLHGLDFDWRPMPESVKTWSMASTSISAQMR